MASQQPSGILASAVIVKARYYLNEASASFWTDIELLSALNGGTFYIVTRTHCLESTEIEELVENQLSYPLTSPYILIRAVVYKQAAGVEKGLIRGNIQSIGHVQEAKVPVYWCEDQDNVIVYPKPDASHSGTGHDIVVYTVTRTSDIASGAAVLTPACYDEALILFIAAQGFFKDRQFNKAAHFMAKCDAECDRYRADFVTRPKEPKEIVK